MLNQQFSVTGISGWLAFDFPEYIAVWISKMDKKIENQKAFGSGSVGLSRKAGHFDRVLFHLSKQRKLKTIVHSGRFIIFR